MRLQYAQRLELLHLHKMKWLRFASRRFIASTMHPEKLFVNSDLSQRYAKYRPRLPFEHVETIVNKLLIRAPKLWIDVGCGPGNSTQQIIGYSQKIIGVDISETQIEAAIKTHDHPSLSFVKGSCAAIPAEDESVDVITAVQAAHYFDLPAFFAEVSRTLKPGGVVSLICYPDPTIKTSTSLSSALDYINHQFLGDYFPDVRKKYFSTRYTSIDLPFDRHTEHTIDLDIPISYPELLDLISSWSGFQNYCNEQGLSVEDGVSVIDREMMKFCSHSVAKDDHVLSYTCTMVSAVKEDAIE